MRLKLYSEGLHHGLTSDTNIFHATMHIEWLAVVLGATSEQERSVVETLLFNNICTV